MKCTAPSVPSTCDACHQPHFFFFFCDSEVNEILLQIIDFILFSPVDIEMLLK